MNKTLLIFLAVSCLAGGCVMTYIESSLNPDYSGRRYGNILVLADLSDIGSQQTVENTVCGDLINSGNNGLRATPGYKIFFQGETYTPQQKARRIKRYGFDSVLSIEFTDSYQTQTYVPPTTTTYGTYGYYGYTAKTYQTGGYYLSQPNFDIRSTLQDAKTFDVVWVSDAHSHGCAICGFDRIIRSFADTLVNRLNVDGVLQLNPTTPSTPLPLPQ